MFSYSSTQKINVTALHDTRKAETKTKGWQGFEKRKGQF